MVRSDNKKVQQAVEGVSKDMPEDVPEELNEVPVLDKLVCKYNFVFRVVVEIFGNGTNTLR